MAAPRKKNAVCAAALRHLHLLEFWTLLRRSVSQHDGEQSFLLSAVDVQHPRPEHAAGPAADSERAAHQHERPAAGEFSPPPARAEHRVATAPLKSLPTHTRELPGRTNKGCDWHVATWEHANLMPLMQILMWRHTARCVRGKWKDHLGTKWH